MRAFIAIELPQDIKDELGKLQDKLKSCQADVKWVLPSNIHLTLKFLGEINEPQVQKVNQIIQDVTKSRISYPLSISSLGAFPKMESPRIIWAGVNMGSAETNNLALELEEKLADLGFPKEDREFSTHITLGRTKSRFNIDKLVLILNTLGNLESLKLNFVVDKITLLKSTLKPTGPVYEVLREEKITTT